ncbi:hypothetical protein BFS14_23105 [Serratia fonticola]|uniref:hypothetical protein n=1 Tax=Serratia fonticola TaxID=47917 RepID=UPI0008FCFF74|nr:hypothetical protein [Serratia fonticola]OIX91588.1 hypothetical protein BFS14_23105 [Serratia fonticola]QCR63285.1 hypothetical protein FD644_24365 [Serratia fonticola]
MLRPQKHSQFVISQTLFFALFPNFDRLEPKSKTYGIIGSALWASFGKNRTYCPYCFTITDDLAKK